MTMKHPGRPKKAASERKRESVEIRMTPDEKRAFRDAAEIAGLPVSAWVRERLRVAAIRELEAVGKIAAFLESLR
jgi:uncharacterized protein (DUF1778 family)